MLNDHEFYATKRSSMMVNIYSLFLLFFLFLVMLSCDRTKQTILKYPNGNVKVIWSYQNDTLNGTKEGFRENGTCDYVVSFKDGREHGKYRAYYDNGFVARAGEFNKGKIHGRHYFYFLSDSGKVETEDYVMTVGNSYYYFYKKRFDVQGALLEDQRIMTIGQDERNAAVFKYVGDVVYDSMKIISGPFNIDFEKAKNGRFDTTDFIKDMAVVPLGDLAIDSAGYIRGKFLGYSSRMRGDTVTVKWMINYFEQKLEGF
ncbi:toxin-antitoxin system YwqK family antitoxin [Chryseolinea lacunae]|uniref:Uncharacterized protein n=1 Tax=Chryseolinea lacunae TaxID=2801331 RepID=A0ABS1L2N9_9BACT|nr:hypothetical protein [Chryseolinea lacunae]MBL0745959.1 hypothetical protein [Chryseolinea lacunae]